MTERAVTADPDLFVQFAAAESLLGAGDIDEAEQVALALCEAYPDHVHGFQLHARCAGARGDWPTALDRWLTCRDRFTARRAHWRVGLAYAFLNTNQLAAAEREFSAALAENPGLIPALAGQALVISQTSPALAEPLWQKLCSLAPGPLKPSWQMARARALADNGNLEQAYAMVRQLLADTPDFPPACTLLTRLLIATGRTAEAAASLANGALRQDGAASPLDRLRLLSWLRWPEGVMATRASVRAALNVARDVDNLTLLLELMPPLFECFERGEMWRALRARAAELPASAGADGLCLRLDIALRDYEGFLARFDAAPPQPAPWGWRFARAAEVLRAPEFPDFAAPKVFGIGLSRTGTSSLGRALDRLGYLHAHFSNVFSNALLGEADFPLFDAVTDTPASMRFETLYTMFPNARFILTDRPYDSWIRSFRHHFERWHQTSDFGALRRRGTQRSAAPQPLELTLLHGALYFTHADPRAAYDAHIRRVEHFFADKPSGKLLRHNVFAGDGWAKLCDFLGHVAPLEPYPWINQTSASNKARPQPGIA